MLQCVIEVLRVISGIISIIILLIGLKFINDLKLRGVDAICGFYSRLKTNLKSMKRNSRCLDACDEPAASTVFMWLSLQDIQEELLKKRNCFSKEMKEIFKHNVISLIKIFDESNGQIPLSNEMYDNLDELYLTLIDIEAKFIKGHPFPFDSKSIDSGTLLDNHEKIIKKSENFDILLNKIIYEIDMKTKELLEKFWKGFKKINVG